VSRVVVSMGAKTEDLDCNRGGKPPKQLEAVVGTASCSDGSCRPAAAELELGAVPAAEGAELPDAPRRTGEPQAAGAASSA